MKLRFLLLLSASMIFNQESLCSDVPKPSDASGSSEAPRKSFAELTNEIIEHNKAKWAKVRPEIFAAWQKLEDERKSQEEAGRKASGETGAKCVVM